jgi:site-specific DNA-methyltransferase (adenine-specific)
MNLLLGNCLELLRTLPDNSIDMVLADLPYGTTACSWDSILPLDILWEQYNRVCKKTGAMVFTASQPFTTILAASNIENFKYEWIWEKPQGTNPMNAKIMPLKSHENILVFCRKKPTYNPQMWYSTPYSGFSSSESKIGEVYGKANSKHRNNPEGSRYPKTVLKFKQEKGLHPTQKPVELMRYLIRTYSNENEVILDNTMGSGTTGVAAILENRQFVGIENDETYFNLAKNRIESTKTTKSVSCFIR